MSMNMDAIQHVDTLASDTLILLSIFALSSVAAYLMDQAIKSYQARRDTIERRLKDRRFR